MSNKNIQLCLQQLAEAKESLEYHRSRGEEIPQVLCDRIDGLESEIELHKRKKMNDKEKQVEKTEEERIRLLDLPEHLGNHLLDVPHVMTNNGALYHYTEVVFVLQKIYKEIIEPLKKENDLLQGEVSEWESDHHATTKWINDLQTRIQELEAEIEQMRFEERNNDAINNQ